MNADQGEQWNFEGAYSKFAAMDCNHITITLQRRETLGQHLPSFSTVESFQTHQDIVSSVENQLQTEMSLN